MSGGHAALAAALADAAAAPAALPDDAELLGVGLPLDAFVSFLPRIATNAPPPTIASARTPSPTKSPVLLDGGLGIVADVDGSDALPGPDGGSIIDGTATVAAVATPAPVMREGFGA